MAGSRGISLQDVIKKHLFDAGDGGQLILCIGVVAVMLYIVLARKCVPGCYIYVYVVDRHRRSHDLWMRMV